MTTFDDREKAFEAKYRLDQETAFKVQVRRDKRLGRWAAELMGLGGQEAEAYAATVVESNFAQPGDDDVVQKVLEDFAAAGVDMDEQRLRKTMDRLGAEARAEIVSEVTAAKQNRGG